MGKNINFLIVGVTGPIGSGCTTLANNIAKVKSNTFIKGKKLYENVVSEINKISIEIKENYETENREKLLFYNKELLKKIEERAYLKSIQKIDDPNFIYIKQFEGIKSTSYFKLYRLRLDKKEMQKVDYVFYNNLY